MAQTQRDEILKAVLERDRSIWRAALPPPESTDVNGGTAVAESIPHPPEPQKRAGLDACQTTEFACGSCMRGAFCMGCKQLAVEPGSVLRDMSSSTTDAAKEDQPKPATDSSTQDREGE